MQPTDEEIAQRLRDILASEAFQPDPTQALWRKILAFLDQLLAWLQGLDAMLRLAIGAACVVALVGLVLHVWSQLVTARRPTGRADEAGLSHHETGATPTMMLQRAENLATAGHLRDAARALQQAVFLDLCLTRQVPWRASTADWEWLALLQPAPEVTHFTRAAQRLAFGPEPTREDFDACAQRAQALLHDRTAA